MLETSARLLRLLSLLQARRFWSGPELAARLEVTDRTLRRDIDRLRNLGYPVDATSGVAGGYQLGAGAELPPLLLADDEALAVAVALGTAAGSTVSGIEEAALRALVKLERVMPPRLAKRVQALRASIIPFERAGPTVDSTLLAALASASREHVQLRFRYEDRADKASDRCVEPHGLVHTGYRWYLVAWDIERADFRTFRVDRIRGKPSSGAPFVPRPSPESGDLRAYVSRSLSSSAYPVQARVLIHAPLEIAAERVSASAGFLERVDAQSCMLSTGAHALHTLAVWISLIGLDFDVCDPPELVDYLRDLHTRLSRTLQAQEGKPRRAQRAVEPSQSSVSRTAARRAARPPGRAR
jgi:predicted DNA-binding transcriptional regulator YafY